MYDGVVTLDESDIPVIIELDADQVRLSASGTEIGLWPVTDCHIAQVTDSVYAITAEDETLQFVPNQPTLFAAAINGGTGPNFPAADPEVELETAGDDFPVTGDGTAPPPKPLTIGLFYALCLVTAGLAVWSLISMIF
jgi:hypothetical protein